MITIGTANFPAADLPAPPQTVCATGSGMQEGSGDAAFHHRREACSQRPEPSIWYTPSLLSQRALSDQIDRSRGKAEQHEAHGHGSGQAISATTRLVRATAPGSRDHERLRSVPAD
jgi:hypothetical protein